VLIEVANDDGVLTDLIVSETQKTDVVWQEPESARGNEPLPGVEELFEQGVFLLQNGLIPKAKAAFADAFRIEPRYAGTLMNLANESANSSAFEAAVFLYQMIIELQPTYRLALENLAITHLNWGVAFARRGVIGKAIEEFNEALLLRPTKSTLKLCKNNLVAAYTALGMQLAANKRHQEGMQFFLLAFQLDPAEEIALKNLALALVAVAASEHKGRGIPGGESFGRFMLMGLTLSECMNAYGATLAGFGKTSEAKIALRKALEIDPHNALVESNLEILESREVPSELSSGIRAFEPRPTQLSIHLQ